MPDLWWRSLRGMTVLVSLLVALLVTVPLAYKAGKLMTVVFYEATR